MIRLSVTVTGEKYRRCGRLFYYGRDRKWNYITRRDTPKKAERMWKLDQNIIGNLMDVCLVQVNFTIIDERT